MPFNIWTDHFRWSVDYQSMTKHTRLLMAITGGIALSLTAVDASADVHSDFARAARADGCRAVPYSDARSSCTNKFRSANARTKRSDCANYRTLRLLARVHMINKLLKRAKQAKDKSKIAKLERELKTTKRTIERNKAEAKKRERRARKAMKDYVKVKGIIGRRMRQRIAGTLKREEAKARARTNKTRDSRYARRFMKLKRNASSVKRNLKQFIRPLSKRNNTARRHANQCDAAYRGRW